MFHQYCGFLYSLSYFRVYPRPGPGPQWHSGIELTVWLICVGVIRSMEAMIVKHSTVLKTRAKTVVPRGADDW